MKQADVKIYPGFIRHSQLQIYLPADLVLLWQVLLGSDLYTT